MKSLLKTIKKLNTPDVIEGYEMESLFNFKIREEKGILKIYDEKENYHIDYLDEMNSLLYDASIEFGTSFIPMETDNIMQQLETAIKCDFGNDSYIEWETNVVMVVVKE